MDVLAVTGFPDIRQKTLIQSGDGGTLLIIPREGGYLTRIYVEMETLAEGERAQLEHRFRRSDQGGAGNLPPLLLRGAGDRMVVCL